MNLTEVQSSNIKSIGYSEDNEILGVVMKSTSNIMYLYENVPIQTYVNFITSDSKGKYFLNEIKGKFQFKKIPL